MRAEGLGQSLEFIKALGSLAIGALLLFIVYTIANIWMADARAYAPGGSGGLIANDWLATGLDLVLPATFLFLVFFGLIGKALLSGRVIR